MVERSILGAIGMGIRHLEAFCQALLLVLATFLLVAHGAAQVPQARQGQIKGALLQKHLGISWHIIYLKSRQRKTIGHWCSLNTVYYKLNLQYLTFICDEVPQDMRLNGLASRFLFRTFRNNEFFLLTAVLYISFLAFNVYFSPVLKDGIASSQAFQIPVEISQGPASLHGQQLQPLLHLGHLESCGDFSILR